MIIWVLGNIFLHKKNKINLKERFWTGLWIGYLTDLLDTLGIGTFATSTALFKATKLVKMINDSATLSTAHVIPVLIEALALSRLESGIANLVSDGNGFCGSSVGTRLTKINTRHVQRALGTLLIIAALIMVYRMIANPGITKESGSTWHLYLLMVLIL